MLRNKDLFRFQMTGEQLFPGFYLPTPFSGLAIFIVIALLGQACVYHSFAPSNCDSNPIIVEVVSKQDTECAQMQGTIEVRVTGGSGSYRFKLNDGEEQTSSFFSGLAAGIHLITAIDENNCSSTIEVIIQNSNGVNIEYAASDAGCQSSNGSITVNPVNGVEPYQFKLNDGTFQDSNVFDHLSAGQYKVTVSDATSCEASLTTLVKSGISFSNSVKPILEENCIKSGCHNGAQFPDLRNFQNVKQNAASIKQQVVTRNMPQNGTLTQFEINSIVCWVDDGAPNN